MKTVAIMACTTLALGGISMAMDSAQPVPSNSFETGAFQWTASGPLVAAHPLGSNAWHAIKDPTVVRHDGKWHLFCSVRGKPRTHATVYLSFSNWSEAAEAPQRVLPCHDGFFCAPQVFYFEPHAKWYLVCQASSPEWDPNYQPAFTTTTTIDDPDSWAPLTPMFGRKPENIKGWLDFWVICDDTKAHLFFTACDGTMWRAETALTNFPFGWSDPVLALKADVFEASHTYRVKGLDIYLTVIEAQHGQGWRYYKAYTAPTLDGQWTPLAAEKSKAFACMGNVTQPGGHWTDNVSHGELLRAGIDQRLEVEPEHLRLLFQGVLDKDRQGKGYGDIPWRLGLLEQVAE
jgi:hypothetical protein